ncbi:MAG: PilZ domain-containing protein [Magnetococcales bacterium]|nr:PilZ domain-containing protein [Magnetococcales bacterium]
MAQQTNPSSQPKQQREFVRVDDHLPLAWRKIDEERFKGMMAYYEQHRTFPRRSDDIHQAIAALDVTDALKKLEQSEPLLSRILVRLDQKLNLLLRLFHPVEGERPMTLTPVNLSGGGISFEDKETGLLVGDVVELRLSLSVDTLTIIECFARVMKIFEIGDNGMTRIACRFEPILDPDRERLIQHIFLRQSELLRAKSGY